MGELRETTRRLENEIGALAPQLYWSQRQNSGFNQSRWNKKNYKEGKEKISGMIWRDLHRTKGIKLAT